MIRKRYTGQVCIFRTGSAEHLEMDIKLDDGTEWYYWKAPEAFASLTYYEGPCKGNLFMASFTANDDGTNPRAVKFIKEVA